MPDIAITVASVEAYDNAGTNSGIAGTTITAGQTLYVDSYDSNKLKLADANAAYATGQVVGVALHGATTGQPITYATSGDIDVGATLSIGMTYVQSATAGGICPVTDTDDDMRVSIIGVALATDKLHLLVYNSNKTSTAGGYASDNMVVDSVVAATAVGTSSIDGDTLDMGATPDYDGVMFIAAFGAITDGTTGLKAQQGAAANMSDAADLANTSTTLAISDDNKMVILDIVKPLERYVRCVVLRGGSTGAVVDRVIALRYRARTLPVSQSSDIATTEQHLSPAEGTA